MQSVNQIRATLESQGFFYYCTFGNRPSGFLLFWRPRNSCQELAGDCSPPACGELDELEERIAAADR
jgi:hypothetical protein